MTERMKPLGNEVTQKEIELTVYNNSGPQCQALYQQTSLSISGP